MEFNQLIPEFDVFNLEETLHFYVDILGFKIEYERKEEKFAYLSFEKVQIMVQELNKGNNKWQTGELEYPLGRGINFEIDIDNIDGMYNSLKNANYELFVDIEEHWYRKDNVLLGNKEFLVKDPNGYLLRFSEELPSKEI
ncbi:MAG: VOC family protein [Clostridiales bacterium]|nr:VOC family protein [Clostridiales bacterium]